VSRDISGLFLQNGWIKIVLDGNLQWFGLGIIYPVCGESSLIDTVYRKFSLKHCQNFSEYMYLSLLTTSSTAVGDHPRAELIKYQIV
jgi:hypothetical protein